MMAALAARAKLGAATPQAPLGADAAELHVTLPAEPESIAAVRAAVRARAEALLVEPSLLADICLAVTEACTNVVLHAYPDDAPGPLHVTLWATPPSGGDRTLTIVVRDRGRGLPRAEDRDGGSPHRERPSGREEIGLGLGLQLMGSLATTFSLGQDDLGHTEVRMSFSCQAGRGHASGATIPLPAGVVNGSREEEGRRMKERSGAP
jgi:serine/threonine-protein kinase RsbW